MKMTRSVTGSELILTAAWLAALCAASAAGWLIAALVVRGPSDPRRQLTPAPVVCGPPKGIGLLHHPRWLACNLAWLAYLGYRWCVPVHTDHCLLVHCAFRVAKRCPRAALLSRRGGPGNIHHGARDAGWTSASALSQYLRLMVVTLTLPFVLELAGPGWWGRMVDGRRLDDVSVGRQRSSSAPGTAALRLKWPAHSCWVHAGWVAAQWLARSSGSWTAAVVNTAAYLVIGCRRGSFTRRRCVSLFGYAIECMFIGAAIAGCLGLAIMVSAWTGCRFHLGPLPCATPVGSTRCWNGEDSGAGPDRCVGDNAGLSAMLVIGLAGPSSEANFSTGDSTRSSLIPPITADRFARAKDHQPCI